LIVSHIKALIFVLAFAIPAFYVAGRIARPIMTAREFAFLRNAWFVATISAFLISNFYLFAAVLTMICFFAHAARAATPALYLVLLYAAPHEDVSISGLGLVNRVFEINNARVLAIVLLLPMMLSHAGQRRRAVGHFALPDRLVLGFALLMIALSARTSETHVLRMAVVYALDVLIPYFVFSRIITSTAEFRKLALAFVIAVLPLALIAVAELGKGWHPYAEVMSAWGAKFSTYGYRAGMLQGTASASGAIVFGFVVMVAIGCMLAVRQTAMSQRFANLALAILVAGLAATLSRGPWVGTMILLITYVATGTGLTARFGKLALAGSLAAFVFTVLTPGATRLASILPFASLGVESIDYRQRLFEQALISIGRNPWFGAEDYRLTPELQEMIQGQGIIDIVNHYLKIALDAGLVGLALFVGFFATILVGLWRARKLSAGLDGDLDLCTRAALATLIAILVVLATASSIDFIPYTYWIFSGMCVALIRIAYTAKATAAHAALANRAAA
jgi:O-antigen ligase